jgi:ring-1,2-phenylacetyl-CoA epoxidase subunit PaaC
VTPEVLLALADDEHLMGHRHSEWVCVAPFLEEDLAFASIGQDELGHAAALYELLSPTDDIEHLAVGRDAADWRSCWLVEQPCRRWEEALVRHFLYDTAERLRWENLRRSSVAGVAAIADRALREEDYHHRHATVLVARLLDANHESRHKIEEGLARLLPLAVAQWEPVAGEEAAVADGTVARSSQALAAEWREDVDAVLRPHGVALEWPAVEPELQRGRTARSEHFAEIQHALTEVIALDPAASW